MMRQAVGKSGQHRYKVCKVAAGPDNPKRPAWAQQSRRNRNADDDAVTDKAEAEAGDANDPDVEKENLLEA